MLVCGPLDTRSPVSNDFLNRLNHTPRVIVTGFLTNPEAVLARAYLLVVPSYREGFGNVFMEAAAMGVPSVAYRVTGVIDAVVHGRTGLLSAPREIPSLVEAIERYLSDENLRDLHGHQARARTLEFFEQEIVWDSIDAFYKKLSA